SMLDPRKVIGDIAKVLAPDGLWVCQMNDEQALVESLEYDTISHEHIFVSSLTALQPLLREHGLECYHVGRNDVNGGSMRLYMRQKGKMPVRRTVHEQLAREQGVDHAAFANNVRGALADLPRFLEDAHRS